MANPHVSRTVDSVNTGIQTGWRKLNEGFK